MNHKTYSDYAWVHLPCLKNALPSKMQKTLQFYLGEEKDKPITTDKFGCSFCGMDGSKKPLLNFRRFYFHEHCVKNAYTVAYGVFLDNEKELLAKMI